MIPKDHDHALEAVLYKFSLESGKAVLPSSQPAIDRTLKGKNILSTDDLVHESLPV